MTYGYKGALSTITLFLIRCPREALSGIQNYREKNSPLLFSKYTKKAKYKKLLRKEKQFPQCSGVNIKQRDKKIKNYS